MRYALFLASVIFLFSSCKKDEPLISETPVISNVFLNKSSIKEYENGLILTLSYEDGNGDLGANDPDVKNLWVKDNRIGIVHAFRIQTLTPNGENIAIRGKLNIELPPMGITNGGNSEAATFSVYLIDRSGNYSNTETTASIIISK